MAVKRFGVAPASGDEELAPGLVPLPFALEGSEHVFTAYPPKRAAWKRSQLSQRKTVPLYRKIEVLVDFLNGCLREQEDADALSDRLLDGTDPLDYAQLLPVVTWLMRSWSEQMAQLNEGKTPTAGLDDPADDPAGEPAAPVAEVQPVQSLQSPAQPQPQAQVEGEGGPVAAAAGLPPVPGPMPGPVPAAG